MNQVEAHLTYTSPTDSFLKKALISSIEYLTGRRKLERLLNELLLDKPRPEQIWQGMLEKIEVTVDYDRQQLDKIGKVGPTIFIANHPFGVVDGIIFGYLVGKIYPKFKFLVNEVLCRNEVLNQFFLPIDFRDSKEAMKTNINTRKQAFDDLQNNIAIVIFPAGGVATAPLPWKKNEDLEWKRFVGKLIKKSKARVIPLYFHGQNSPIFQFVSLFSLNVRLGLLLNEVRNKIGKTIKVEIGDPLEYEDIVKPDRDLLLFLRNKVFSLGKTTTNG